MIAPLNQRPRRDAALRAETLKPSIAMHKPSVKRARRRTRWDMPKAHEHDSGAFGSACATSERTHAAPVRNRGRSSRHGSKTAFDGEGQGPARRAFAVRQSERNTRRIRVSTPETRRSGPTTPSAPANPEMAPMPGPLPERTGAMRFRSQDGRPSPTSRRRAFSLCRLNTGKPLREFPRGSRPTPSTGKGLNMPVMTFFWQPALSFRGAGCYIGVTERRGNELAVRW
ncbi:hypothetical protein QOZ94_004112 [Xanthobacter agilis]|jgi:hypothetical protein|uniref:Uncharacterized protein n=1 Tax=Xanthobacter agilis TaxID=47492 RepID=A0ABU0LJH4_XANAG|nr:hypothetical protein [Xanthobacter agilis]